VNEFVKTALFVAAAIGCAIFAYATLPSGVDNALFDDQGQEFFPEFTSSEQAAFINVRELVDGELEPFAVRREGRGWVIPSHDNYPADATQLMADAATIFVGLRKQRARSDVKTDWARFGVLDPEESRGAEADGVGRRVTFKDAGDKVLADLIIGNEVEGSTDLRYVRVPGKKRVYEAKITAEVPVAFEEWIEKDLLKSNAAEMTKVEWDNYSVDETRNALVPGEKFAVVKGDDNQWKLADQQDSEATDSAKVSAMTNAISGLKIVGVRPKFEGLTETLERASGRDKMALAGYLRGYGYFVGPDDKLVSNEGDLMVHTNKGVLYTLKFGEVVRGTGKAISSSASETKPDNQPDSGDPNGDAPEIGPAAPPDGRPNRYLMITVEVDPELVKPEGTPIATEEMTKRQTARFQLEEIRRAIQTYKDRHDGALPESLTVLTEGEEPALEELRDDPWGNPYQYSTTDDGFSVVSYGADKAAGGEGADADVDLDMLSRENDLKKVIDDHAAYEKKLAAAKEQVSQLRERFGPWFYLIDATSYDKLKVKRADLVTIPAEDANPDDVAPGTFPGGTPGLPGGIPGLPGGGTPPGGGD